MVDNERLCHPLGNAWLDKLQEEHEGYATQGGGRVQWDKMSKCYRFTVAPDVPGYEVGDRMPEDWGMVDFSNKKGDRY